MVGQSRAQFIRQAEEALKQVGFEPLEPYPGSTRKPWRSRCMTCARESSPQLDRARRGNGCVLCELDRKDAEREAHQHTFRVGPGRQGTIQRWVDTVPVMSDEWQGVPQERAEEQVRAAGFEPLQPYPNSVDIPWPCQCTACGKESSPRLSSIRQGSGCRFCAPNARVAPGQAEADMRAAGFEPLDPYPGHSRSPWRCQCTTCGRESTPCVEYVRRGSRCRACSGIERRLPSEEAEASARAAGFEPLEPYQGNKTPWRCRCTTCGNESSPRLNAIRQGTGCKFCMAGRPADPDAEMRAAGFEPLEPYPGDAHKPWQCRCSTCGSESLPRLNSVRRGTGCGFCARRNRRLSPEDAVGVMRVAGFEPLEDYPGSKKPWRCRCTVCGEESTPQLSSVRKGRGCRVCSYRRRGKEQSTADTT